MYHSFSFNKSMERRTNLKLIKLYKRNKGQERNQVYILLASK